MTTSELGQMSVEELDRRIDAIDHSDTDEFVDLIRLAGLDPLHALRFGDFSSCRLDGQDLRGFVFTGCDLTNASFKGALIEGAKFDCARVDIAALRLAADYAAYSKTDFDRPPHERHRVRATRLRDLAIFRDAPFAPEMVVMPAGEFDVGSDLGEAKLGEDDQAFDSEIVPGQGKRRMRIPRRFAMGRYPVTFEEYDVFCDVTRRKLPKDFDWGRNRRPVVDVSWDDVQAYVSWLNGKIGAGLYRLPSEAEWEYACRAGTTTRRWWGNSWDPRQANGAKQFEGGRTSLVGAYPANLEIA
jgi:formylglycine-generating enzyme required for sulfatase activity